MKNELFKRKVTEKACQGKKKKMQKRNAIWKSENGLKLLMGSLISESHKKTILGTWELRQSLTTLQA